MQTRIPVLKLMPRLCLCLLAALPITMKAQFTVKGKITDESNGLPLQGATVTLKGSSRATSSSSSGDYLIKIPNGKGTLVVSSVGYGRKEIPVNNRNNIHVKLEAATADLNEVVVVGYGTQKKKDLTGAVAQVKAEKLENENPGNVQDILRGNVPGLNISQINSASAKGGGDLLVRGKSSINAGTTPLIVVDGVIYYGQLSDINPNDISTIDILKDASSAAVFGAKAASGVVLITTKKGATGPPKVTLNTNFGFGEVANNESLYDGPGFVAWRTDVQNSRFINHAPYEFDDPGTLPSDISIDEWLAYDNSTGDPIDVWLTRLGMKPVEIRNYKAGKTTDWYDMMFRKGFRQDHTVSLSGKKDDVSYYMSVGYTNNEGVVVGDEFSTIRTRLNLEGKIAKYLSVGLNIQFADRDESSVPATWSQMVNASPYGEVYNDDTNTLRDSPNDDLGNNANPFRDMYYTNRLEKTNTLFGSLYAKGTLPAGFSYQVNFTPHFEFYRYFNGVSADHPSYRTRKGLATRTDQTIYTWQIDNILKWDKTFGEHTFNVTLLANAEKYQSWRTQIDNEGFDPNDNLSYHNIGAGIKPTTKSDDQVSTGNALMARLNYSLSNKYLLTLSYRRDGYSAFGQGNPTAYFPAAALGWVFTNEKFMEGATWLNSGKLRLSWGINGNRDIGRYEALSNLTTGKYQYITPSGEVIPVSQLWVDRMSNPGLKWEKTTSYNVGFDFSVLADRLSGSIDLYKKSTSDLLIKRSLPTVIGFDDVMDNLGEVENKGIEINLNSVNINNENFSWRTGASFWLNRNKIVHLYGPVNIFDEEGKVIGQVERDDLDNEWFIGHDLDEIWDQRVLGVWQSDETEEAAQYGVYPGDFKVQDVDGDGKYSDADRQFLGYKSPRFQWTLRNDFTILKNFDLSFMLYSSWGQKASFNDAKNNSGFKDRQNSYIFPYWTPGNPINDYARLYSSNGGASFSVYRKTSFIRLNNVALAYNFPAHVLDRIKFESMKVYVNVTNAAMYAPDWEFWDPEFRNRNSEGEISTAIPPRYYTVGLNVTF
ncbi:MAG: SusC/RagA family TonB-linked outer membrane protein [Chitinophagaceae bacterium]|nr:SusC/RagA family TonB-linked outer membrane protein [Chitinophagaceae bacterium]